MAWSLVTTFLDGKEVERLTRQSCSTRRRSICPSNLYSNTSSLKRLPLTRFARRFHVIQEGQIGVDDAQPLAGFARSFRVEAKETGGDLIALGKGFANVIHNARVGGWVGAGGDAYRGLINHNCIWMLAQKGLMNQRAFARPGHARHDG